LGEIDDAIAAYERGDFGPARKSFERATAGGDPLAARYLAIMHRAGQGVKANDRQAVTYFRRAAEAGDLPSQLGLAELYEAGRGIRRNYPAAADWYRRAADRGSALAMTRLASLREQGLDSTADLSEAAVWYRRGAELGDSEAQAKVAALYAEGRGVERNPVEALIWACAAADANADAKALHDRLIAELPALVQAEAWYRLALMQSSSDAAKRDTAAIAANFKRAGELGHMRRCAGSLSAISTATVCRAIGRRPSNGFCVPRKPAASKAGLAMPRWSLPAKVCRAIPPRHCPGPGALPKRGLPTHPPCLAPSSGR
jgi:TPR repeat protein